MMTRLLRKTAALVVLTSIAATVFALPAVAASKHAISGTCERDAMWYVSQIDRPVASNGTAIRAAFYDLCAKPMYFKVINAHTGAQIGSTIIASGDVKTIATNVRAGTEFNNAFKLSSAVSVFSDRTFAGSEWY